VDATSDSHQSQSVRNNRTRQDKAGSGVGRTWLGRENITTSYCAVVVVTSIYSCSLPLRSTWDRLDTESVLVGRGRPASSRDVVGQSVTEARHRSKPHILFVQARGSTPHSASSLPPQPTPICYTLLHPASYTTAKKTTELLQNLVVSSGAGPDPTYHGLVVTWQTAAGFLRAAILHLHGSIHGYENRPPNHIMTHRTRLSYVATFDFPMFDRDLARLTANSIVVVVGFSQPYCRVPIPILAPLHLVKALGCVGGVDCNDSHAACMRAAALHALESDPQGRR
jgi:hypothetical protein